MLDGVAGAINREERGIKGVRGKAAVATLRAEIARFRQLKAQWRGGTNFWMHRFPEHGPSGLARLGGTL
ncbi:hypothetical protein [Bosea rubneri]|uniref:Transposase n=1 Tax=Bosea rubneri TaxID=3075434 RepID=A0ABU3SAP1_9HYPH|nr:hypothetical protein [Bosea sp. ZW T0_25]MDU0341853.1 hypothetical protein [Bosea sp. ZW T0_25]